MRPPTSALRPKAVVLIGATTLIMICGLTIGDYPIIDGRFPAAIGGNSSWGGYPAPAHQCFRKAKRRRRERPRRRAGDQRHKEQRRHRQPEAQPKTVNVSEHVGLPLHPRRKRAHGPRQRGGGAMAGKTIRQVHAHERDSDYVALLLLT